MIQILAGAKGEGKTKKLLDMANESAKICKGNVVFIDDDNRIIYDLHQSIRFVQTTDCDMKDLNVLFGFICGILSQNNDIEKMFIDGINNIVDEMSDNSLDSFIENIENISSKLSVDFVMTLNQDNDQFTEKVKEYIIL